MLRHPIFLALALIGLLAAEAATAAGETVKVPAKAGEPLYVLVTPEGIRGGRGKRLSCQFGPESEPPQVKDDLVRFKVQVPGMTSRLQWRVPLFDGPNGDNSLSVARVGVVTPEPDGGFIIDLNVTDLQRAMERDRIAVQVRTQEGREITCSTPTAPVAKALLKMPPKELMIVNGSLER